jgi:hypothetical protein
VKVRRKRILLFWSNLQDLLVPQDLLIAQKLRILRHLLIRWNHLQILNAEELANR